MASVFDEYAQEVAEKVSQERRGVFSLPYPHCFSHRGDMVRIG